MMVNPRIAVRVLETLPVYEKSMLAGEGMVTKNCLSRNYMFIRTPSIFVGRKAEYANWIHTVYWTITPAFIKVLNENLRQAFDLYFPGAKSRLQKDERITWELFKGHLDRTIFSHDDDPALRKDPFAVVNRIELDIMKEALHGQVRVHLTRAIYPKYRKSLHKRLDWDKIRTAYHEQQWQNVLERNENPRHGNTIVKRLPGVKRVASYIWPKFEYAFLKRRYWYKGIPEKWFMEDANGNQKRLDTTQIP